MSNSIENNEQGFTVVEMVVGLLIGLIFLGAALKIFVLQQKAYDQQEQISELHQNIRVAMDMITRETRLAGYNPTEAAFYGIEYAPTQLIISADLDGDGVQGAAGTNEDIIYTYAPGPDFQIRRAEGGGAAQPFVEDIEEFNIKYYEEDGDEIIWTVPTAEYPTIDDASAAIREIQIEITGRTSKPDLNKTRVLRQTDPTADFVYGYGTLTSFITPPNLSFAELNLWLP